MGCGSGRGLVVRALDSGLSRGFDPHTGHGSLLKLRQFHLHQFASVYPAANEYWVNIVGKVPAMD